MSDDTLHPALQPAPEPAKPGGIFSGSLGSKPAEKAPDTAAAKLRAFEDKHLGKKAMRNNDGHVEKGFGSPFKAMTSEQHAEYAALEKLVEAEAAVDAANVELTAAKVVHEAAKAALVEATKVANAAAPAA